MRNLILLLISVIVVFSLVAGCERDKTEQNKEVSSEDSEKSLEKVNRYLLKSELKDIKNYIRRHGWDMEETGSGLFYQVYQEGDGEKATEGKIALIEYKTWLINGDLVYSSDDIGPKEFLIGKGGVESGLEEGILLLKEGDKARFILPAHLAYGLLGDNNRIPPRTAIVYELELINLK